MPIFLLGLYIAVVGITGNAGGLVEEISTDGPFIPFAVACAIVYGLWVKVPPPEQKPVRLIIVAAILGVVLFEYQRIILAVTSGWQALINLGNTAGGVNSNDTQPGTNATTSTTAPTLGGTSSAYNTNIGNILQSGYGNLTAGQIAAESGGNQYTSTGQPLISSAGAVGTAQILPSTAQQVAASLGIPYSQQELENNQEYNLTLGSAYMGQLLSQFNGNTGAALAAYNMGPNAAAVQQYYQTGDISVLPQTVQNYVTQGLGN